MVLDVLTEAGEAMLLRRCEAIDLCSAVVDLLAAAAAAPLLPICVWVFFSRDKTERVSVAVENTPVNNSSCGAIPPVGSSDGAGGAGGAGGRLDRERKIPFSELY